MGCATIISGSSQTVTMEAEPEGAILVVVSGTIGKYLIKGAQTSDSAQDVLDILEPHIDPEITSALRQFTFDQLVTWFVVYTRVEDGVSLIPGEVAELLGQIPKPLITEVLSYVGVETYAVAPAAETLDTDSSYIVLGYAEGRAIDTAVIDNSLNPWIFLNVFNLGLGAIVDLLTGAWAELDTDAIRLELGERTAPVIPGVTPAPESAPESAPAEVE